MEAEEKILSKKITLCLNLIFSYSCSNSLAQMKYYGFILLD